MALPYDEQWTPIAGGEIRVARPHNGVPRELHVTDVVGETAAVRLTDDDVNRLKAALDDAQ